MPFGVFQSNLIEAFHKLSSCLFRKKYFDPRESCQFGALSTDWIEKRVSEYQKENLAQYRVGIELLKFLFGIINWLFFYELVTILSRRLSSKKQRQNFLLAEQKRNSTLNRLKTQAQLVQRKKLNSHSDQADCRASRERPRIKNPTFNFCELTSRDLSPGLIDEKSLPN